MKLNSKPTSGQYHQNWMYLRKTNTPPQKKCYFQFNVIVNNLKYALILPGKKKFLILPLEYSIRSFSVFLHQCHSLLIISSVLSSNFTRDILNRRLFKTSRPHTHTYPCIYDGSLSSIYMEGPFMIHFSTRLHSLLSQEYCSRNSPTFCISNSPGAWLLLSIYKCDIYFPTLIRNPLSTPASTSTSIPLLYHYY